MVAANMLVTTRQSIIDQRIRRS